MHNITVIGGGTGSFVVLSGIKNLQNTNITSITCATDSGGSSGRLRDEFGYLPAGDTRRSILALSGEGFDQNILRQLFAYRFDKGENGLKGHNFGNLFMTALRDVVGDELHALEILGKLFRTRGKVMPITLEKTDLVAEYENGSKLIGEENIDEPKFPHDGRLRITKLSSEPKVQSHSKVKQAIIESDLIILGPGDLYTSLLANFIFDDVIEWLNQSKAKIVFISNLVTKFGQTYGFRVSDFVNELEKYIRKPLDYILVNNTELPKDILEKYHLENSQGVLNNMNEDPRVIETDLLASEEIKRSQNDIVKRSLIRHDPEKIARVIEGLLC